MSVVRDDHPGEGFEREVDDDRVAIWDADHMDSQWVAIDAEYAIPRREWE